VLFQEITSAQRKLSMSSIINSTHSEVIKRKIFTSVKATVNNKRQKTSGDDWLESKVFEIFGSCFPHNDR
jgi:hypothetical protein